jgi:hypothetical protein
LAIIPFVRLKEFAAWDEDKLGFSEHIASVQQALQDQVCTNPQIHLDSRTLELWVGNQHIAFTPTEAALYQLLLRTKLDCGHKGCADCVQCYIDPFELNTAFVVDFLRQHWGHWSERAEGIRIQDKNPHELKKWVPMDPRTGVHGLPEDTLLWQRGGKSLLDVTGGEDSQISFSMLRQTMPAMDLVRLQQDTGGISRFSLYSLPIEEQSVFKLLLLLPLGALIVTFMRIIVGIRTSGTFMPVLLALSFLQTQLVQGLTAFVLIIALGLVLRSYLSRLNLLMVARISTLIVLVIFLTSIISIIGHQLGFNLGLTITFFPMIIIAWIIERMSILWEEDGSREVFIQGLGSLSVAVLSYLCMRMDIVRHLTFNFPELHLVLLGSILMMGQYTGYKLSELKRFGVMRDKN